MGTLLISEIFPPKHGGSGRWFWELYSRLPRETIHIATHDWPGSDVFDRSHGIPISRLSLPFRHWGVLKPRGLVEYLRACRAIRKVIRATRPDLIHCGRCVPEGFLAWMLRMAGGPPYWCYAHGEELTYAKSSRELGWMARRSLSGAQRLIANSSNTRDLLLNDWKIPQDKVRVLNPGVDTKVFVPAPRNPTVRKDLGWNERPVILTVGALSARKGQDMMIRALPAIRHSIPDVLYSVAGEGWERPRLEQLASDLSVVDHVQFRGPPLDRELIDCYQQCDLFALPNRQAGCDVEGFGIVLLEAQACGKPVLAGTSGGTSETMRLGETGCVLDCTTPDHLAKTVVEWLRDPTRMNQMGVAARAWVAARFDWNVLSEQAINLFASPSPLP